MASTIEIIFQGNRLTEKKYVPYMPTWKGSIKPWCRHKL